MTVSAFADMKSECERFPSTMIGLIPLRPKSSANPSVVLIDQVHDKTYVNAQTGEVYPRLRNAKTYIGRDVEGCIKSHLWKVYTAQATPRDPANNSADERQQVMQSIQQEVSVALQLGNAFAPTAAWVDVSRSYYVQYPVHRAELRNVLGHVHQESLFVSHADARRLRDLVAVRMIHDVLPQLVKLHGMGMAHNNINAANIFMDNDLHFHLADFTSVKPSYMAPTSGVWINKRPDAFVGTPYNPQADDLWALGKLMIKALLGPRVDPFLLSFIYPKTGDEGLVMQTGVEYHEAYNAIIARDLISKWRTMHKAYEAWWTARTRFHKTNRSQHYLEPFPTFTEAEHDPATAIIAKVFKKLSRRDEAGIFLKLALIMFDPRPRNEGFAESLKRYCWPFIDKRFAEPTLPYHGLKQVAPPDGLPQNVPYFEAATENVEAPMDEACENEIWVRNMLDGVEGTAWSLTNPDEDEDSPLNWSTQRLKEEIATGLLQPFYAI